MPRETEVSLNERDFILKALSEQVRLDGRKFDAFRSLELSFGQEYGVADVKLGKTRVIARISAEVTAPYVDRRFDGIFTISTEFSPMASPAVEVGRQNDAEVLLSRILEKSIRRSSALDTESLCIIAGAKCFSIRADIHVVDHDGSLIDASCIALVAALQHFRRPDVSVEGENVTVYSIREREPVPLAMLHHPLCITISHYHSGDVLLVDASLAEEQVREGQVIISMNRHGELCHIAQYGGVPIDPLLLMNCTSMAFGKVKELTNTIHEQLEKDAKERDAGGLIAELSAENER
ncbi:exoribonuclease [Pseudovirgaria hyperparasitica]|uniref:Exosome complex component RRP45 n=1 Tax=Pseudovirgaria hyperparasitica TaxID=470096 RepID=A0A6A6WM69_9PEZI|nr:exoribonuclease [Pseudovirgaria hyperparasitica]KAF2763310.1 exoribonuclease [Pseudovirgaria hyperparasitica]